MGLTLVYFGEHYVTDIVAGWLYVGGSFWFWGRWEKRRSAAILTPSPSEPGVA
jgi:membrane-associated phospholipid phosphatase